MIGVDGRKLPKKITDAALRNAKPADKPYKLTVGNGLYLEVASSGSKLWRWRYRLGGKENVYAIGSYPEISLKDAGKLMEEARALVKAGIHPAQQRKLDKIKTENERSNTVEALALEWLEIKEWEEITKAVRLAMLKRHIFPHIGALPVRQVTPAHILDILKRTAKTGPTVADQARRTLSGVFELAISTLRADIDPTQPVKKALPPNKTQHKRPLTAEEIGQLMGSLDDYTGNFQTVAAFRLMWWTLCRPTEATGAEWAELDLDAATWTIAAKRMKKRVAHALPLPSQAVEMLRAMQPITGRFAHVFPHRDDKAKPMDVATLRNLPRVIGWKGQYSPHATRTTGSTHLNEMGYPADWIERQLAHAEPNAVRRTYNHAAHMDDRRIMMQQWANWLDGVKTGAAVISLRRGAAA